MIDVENEIEDGVIFCNTSNKIEVTKGYSITGAPLMEHHTYKGQLSPCSARLTFRDGDISDLVVTAKIVKNDGEPSENRTAVPFIHGWNMQEWPIWLKNLYQLACIELAADRKVSA